MLDPPQGEVPLQGHFYLIFFASLGVNDVPSQIIDFSHFLRSVFH
jgi:hypothetical protein